MLTTTATQNLNRFDGQKALDDRSTSDQRPYEPFPAAGSKFGREQLVRPMRTFRPLTAYPAVESLSGR